MIHERAKQAKVRLTIFEKVALSVIAISCVGFLAIIIAVFVSFWGSTG